MSSDNVVIGAGGVTNLDVYREAGNRLAFALAANSGDPDRIRHLLLDVDPDPVATVQVYGTALFALAGAVMESLIVAAELVDPDIRSRLSKLVDGGDAT